MLPHRLISESEALEFAASGNRKLLGKGVFLGALPPKRVERV